MSYTPIDPISTALRSQSQDAFDAAIAAFMTQFPTTLTQINTSNSEANASAIAAAGSVVAAIAQVALATTQAGNAAASAAAASNAEVAAGIVANAPKWVSGQNVNAGEARWAPADTLTYRAKVNLTPSTVDPSVDTTNWVLQPRVRMVKKSRAANTALTVSDHGSLIEFTAGFTQTYASCSSLGNGWYIFAVNNSSADVTHDPNASETIDGVTSGVQKPGMAYLIQCDGSALSVTRIDSQVITEYRTGGTSGAWPLGVRRAKLRMTGGGSSGYFAGNSSRLTGPAAGYLEKTLAVAPGTSFTYSIGVGGAATTSSAPPSNPGGDSTFIYGGVTYTASGGAYTGSQFTINPGGSASNGDINIRGGSAEQGTGVVFIAKGGCTPLGNGGTDGESASGYGAGGGGGLGGTGTTGAGTPGIVILEY